MALPTSLPDHCSSPLSPAGWRNWTSPHGRLLSRSPDYCSKSTKSKNGATTVATAVDAHAIITKSCYVRYRDLLTRYVFGANLGASGQTVGRERPGRCLPETAGTGYNALPLLSHSHSQHRRAKRGSIMLCEVWEHLAVIRAFPIYRQHVPGPLQRKDGKDKQVAEEWNVCMCVGVLVCLNQVCSRTPEIVRDSIGWPALCGAAGLANHMHASNENCNRWRLMTADEALGALCAILQSMHNERCW